jgi:hypothetical protein
VLISPFVVETVGLDGTLHWVLKHRSSAGTTICLDLQKLRKFDAAVLVDLRGYAWMETLKLELC